MNRANHVLYINPAHPLLPIADLAADAELERRQHFSQRASLGTEHNSGTHLDRANACMNRSLRCRLPLAADIGKESAAGSAVLVQDFAAAVAVVPNRRTARENMRLV